MAEGVSLESTIDYTAIEGALSNASDENLHYSVVNAPFDYPVFAASLFLGIVVLLLVDKATGTINRIAITDNMHAERAKRRSAKRFEEIKIPLNHQENIIAKAINSGEPQFTVDWHYLFVPELTSDQARFNQADSGIGFSAVYPVKSGLIRTKAVGALIFSYYQFPEKVGRQQRNFMRKYAEIVSRVLAKRSGSRTRRIV
jgi:hypothetical protein